MIVPAEDATPGEWLTRSAGEDGTFHTMVPAVFGAYARVFHPASLGEREVRWSEVAAANGRSMHGAAEWGQLTGSWRLEEQDGLWDLEPVAGELVERPALRLAAILAEHTSTPERCWFGIWDGWGLPSTSILSAGPISEHERRRIGREREVAAEEWEALFRRAPLFEMPNRKYHLLRGALSELSRFYCAPDRRPPSIWWPEDRAWCVGADTDLMSTYLGATAAAVESVARDVELEALAIPAGQDVTWEADTLNPPADSPPF